MTKRTDPWQAAFTVLSVAAAVLLYVGLFGALADHPALAALWALVSTTGAVWLGYLYAARRHDDHLRALSAAREHRAVEAPKRVTVTDLILQHRLGRRIGDAERDVFVAALHTHFAAGRLTPAELEDRLAAALAARTIDDLMLTVHDLPNEVTGL